MYDKNLIEKRIRKLNLSDYAIPSSELMDEILSEGKTRIINTALDNKKLDKLSEKYFEFCWTQVGHFGFHNRNAIEIGFVTQLPPIHIACAINRYGADWAVKLLHMKRITLVDRGDSTVIKTGECFFAVSDLKRNLRNYISSRLNSDFHRVLKNRTDFTDLRNVVADRSGLVSDTFRIKTPIFSIDLSGIAAEEKKRKRTPKDDYRPRFDGIDAEPDE